MLRSSLEAKRILNGVKQLVSKAKWGGSAEDVAFVKGFADAFKPVLHESDGTISTKKPKSHPINWTSGAANDEGPALICAITRQNNLMRDALLDCPEIDVNVAHHGFTPLYFAVSAGDLELVKNLLAHGADTTIKYQEFIHRDDGDYSGNQKAEQTIQEIARINLKWSSQEPQDASDKKKAENLTAIIEIISKPPESLLQKAKSAELAVPVFRSLTG